MTVVGTVEALYRAEGDRLWRSVMGYCGGDAGVADDAVAEAFAQLLRRGDAVRDPHGWIWRAAFRIAAGELQRRGLLDSLVVDCAVDDEDPLVAWELLAALGTLSDQQRAVVILRDYAGHSGREVAAIVGTSEQTVRVQLSRARRTLRDELS